MLQLSGEHSIKFAMVKVYTSSRTGLPIVLKSPPCWSRRCSTPPPAQLLEGIALFNSGAYWESHEVLEGLWRTEADAVRGMYQGVILLAAGCWHLQRGNDKGGVAKVSQALDYLTPYRPACQGVFVARLCEEVSQLLTAIRSADSHIVLVYPLIHVDRSMVYEREEDSFQGDDGEHSG